MGITIVYPAGADPGEQVTLTLPGSNFEEESGYIACDDIKRTLDGTANSYRPFNKRRKPLKWQYLTTAQKSALEFLWAVGCSFTFADEADADNQFTAIMMASPLVRQIGLGIWEGEVEVQEV